MSNFDASAGARVRHGIATLFRAGLSVLSFFAGVGAAVAAPDLTLSVRVDAQRAIEDVAWRHRVWPAVNKGPKPALAEVLPPQRIEARVRDGLRMSAALETYWRHPLTREQLSAEVERMTRETRDPRRLRETFAALGNDPVLIRECLARPIVAERLARNWYAFDDRWHGGLELLARSGGGEHATHVVEFRPGVPRASRTRTRTLDESAVTFLDAAAWGALNARTATTPRSSFVETADAFIWKDLIEQTPDRITVRERIWRKVPFESWWAVAAAGLRLSTAVATSGPVHAPEGAPAPGAASGCNPDSWLSDAGMSGIDALTEHTAVWTGTEMIVWGGFNEGSSEAGFRYDPATDTWSRIAVSGAPGARSGHTAVWTGTEMIVWGGAYFALDLRLDSGGRFNPVTNTWTPTSLTGAPLARDRHSAVWTGSEMIVWGGDTGGSSPTDTGARYDPAANSWTDLLATGAPLPRWDHTAVWSGSEMIVWGGEDLNGPRDDGARYGTASVSWNPLPAVPASTPARMCHTAVWTGSEMIVWGGNTGVLSPTNSGARYNLAANSWTDLPTAGAPLPRWDHTAVWTGSEMIVWGGDDGYFHLGDGARYTPGAASWVALPGGDAPQARAHHTAVWTGSEMIVWGGMGGGVPLNTGGRYVMLPEEAWLPTSTMRLVPTARWRHTGVWTGAELIVWGGENGVAALPDGGRYDPALATWSPIAAGGAPLARTAHTAVWTGTEVIVWGGGTAPLGAPLQYNDGARYNPATDAWSATSVVNAPLARAHHEAVWTGSEMIVWGGGDYGTTWRNTGGRYNPATDTWQPTSTAAGVPSGRDSHTATWTGRELIVWGGYNGVGDLDTGARYNPASDSWTALPVAGAPASRFDHTSAWTSRELIVWGGFDYDTATTLDTGARFNPETSTWSPVAAAGAPAGRTRHTATWTGERMIVWGGVNEDGADPEGPIHTGGLYDPASDTWLATSVGPSAPAGRELHVAAWAGSNDGRLFLWGGYPGTQTGGIYCGLSCTAAPPSGASRLSVGKDLSGTAQISWTALAGATGHDVVRGGLRALRTSAGSFASSTARCVANNTSTNTASDGEPPGPEQGFWYLQRGRNCGGAGTYDSGALPAEGRDAGIAASGSACP